MVIALFEILVSGLLLSSVHLHSIGDPAFAESPAPGEIPYQTLFPVSAKWAFLQSGAMILLFSRNSIAMGNPSMPIHLHMEVQKI